MLVLVAGGEMVVADEPAQARGLAEASYVHRQWRMEDGLPINSLSGVAPDGEGYIWLGTYDGLVRFDGHRMVTGFSSCVVVDLC